MASTKTYTYTRQVLLANGTIVNRTINQTKALSGGQRGPKAMRVSDDDRQAITSARDSGRSIADISRETGISPYKIRKALIIESETQ